MIENLNTALVKSPPVLATSRLILKPVIDTLRPFVFNTLSDAEVRAVMKMPVLDEEGKQNRWWSKFENWRVAGRAMQWCAFDAKTDGYIGLFTIKEINAKNSRGELGYSIVKEKWGKGYGGEGAAAVVEFAFLEVGFHTLFAMILPYNVPSQSLVKRLGFRQEAHFKQMHYYDGEFYDVLQFSAVNLAHSSKI
jgi:ribosomal-protein-alanine N-acetyltransferase